jgi:hypothetical protein
VVQCEEWTGRCSWSDCFEW